jgi:type VI secretion system secreted protein Hcp
MNRRLRQGVVLVAVGVAVIISTTPVGAALNTYLFLEGQNQGAIPGEVTQAGREDSILVTEVHHLIHLPVDPDTGQIIGSLRHQPFIFTKGVDRSSVPMYAALANNEILTADFRYYRPGGGGQEVQYFTIVLINARIIAIEPIKPETQDAITAALPDMERVRMVYQQIEIHNELFGQQVTIDNQPVP